MPDDDVSWVENVWQKWRWRKSFTTRMRNLWYGIALKGLHPLHLAHSSWEMLNKHVLNFRYPLLFAAWIEQHTKSFCFWPTMDDVKLQFSFHPRRHFSVSDSSANRSRCLMEMANRMEKRLEIFSFYVFFQVKWHYTHNSHWIWLRRARYTSGAYYAFVTHWVEALSTTEIYSQLF